MLEMIVKNTKSATREKARRVEEHKFTVNTQEIDSRIKQLEQRIKEYESPKTQCMVPADRLSDYKKYDGYMAYNQSDGHHTGEA